MDDLRDFWGVKVGDGYFAVRREKYDINGRCPIVASLFNTLKRLVLP